MKKILFFAGIILIVSSCAMEKVHFDQLQNRDGLYYMVNDKEPFSGEIVSYEEGKIELEGNVQNGLKDGLWIYYYPNGQKKAEGMYKDGLKEGTWSYWAENGEQANKKIYKRGNKLQNTEETIQIEMKSDDGSEGTITIKGDDGTTEGTITIEGDDITIKVKEDKGSATVKKKSTEPKAVNWSQLTGGHVKSYKGKPYTGPVVKYYKEGNKGKYLYGYFTNGRRSGKWTYYHRDGSVKDTKNY